MTISMIAYLTQRLGVKFSVGGAGQAISMKISMIAYLTRRQGVKFSVSCAGYDGAGAANQRNLRLVVSVGVSRKCVWLEIG